MNQSQSKSSASILSRLKNCSKFSQRKGGSDKQGKRVRSHIFCW